MGEVRRKKKNILNPASSSLAQGNTVECLGACIKLLIYFVFWGQLLLMDVIVKMAANISLVRLKKPLCSDYPAAWGLACGPEIQLTKYMLAINPPSETMEYQR